MRKIRVLVVDDSTVIRRLLTNSLVADEQIEVCGTAANGRIALAKIPQLNPDLVTLDIEMPEMDGITTVVELRKLYPKLPIIMFSTLTQRGAEATMDALSKGANDYVTKPANVGSVNAAMLSVRNELVPRIKAFCPWASPPPPLTKVEPLRPAKARDPNRTLAERVDAVVIGSSTGGPTALQTIIGQLPASFPVPIMVVQHMPPIFTKHLADRLNQLSALRVVEAANGDTLESGRVLLAPGDYHMQIRRAGTKVQVVLDQGTPENSCRPAVDVLFRSAAKLFGSNLMSVVLTGMGRDGARGCESVHDAGGRILIQDQASSVVWGMPGAVARAGLEDSTLPLNKIAEEITIRASNGQRNVKETAACR